MTSDTERELTRLGTAHVDALVSGDVRAKTELLLLKTVCRARTQKLEHLWSLLGPIIQGAILDQHPEVPRWFDIKNRAK